MFYELRNQYKEFIYESFQVEESEEKYTVTYHYYINELSFSPQIIVEKNQITNKSIDRDFLNYLFFSHRSLRQSVNPPQPPDQKKPVFLAVNRTPQS